MSNKQPETEANGNRYQSRSLDSLVGIPLDAQPTKGRGLFSPSMCRGVGAWIFKKASDVPDYLSREATQGRVFLFPNTEMKDDVNEN